jgi:hypothetical protein
MGKDRAKVCSICGKQEDKGWYSHWKRKHPKEEVNELIVGMKPLNEW